MVVSRKSAAVLKGSCRSFETLSANMTGGRRGRDWQGAMIFQRLSCFLFPSSSSFIPFREMYGAFNGLRRCSKPCPTLSYSYCVDGWML